MRQKTNTIAYLRLPPRTALDKTQNVDDFALPYAIAARGRLLQTGMTSLALARRELAAAHTVVLLVAASDVTLLRVEVPPLPAHRLHLVLPALVEDRLIGDVSECVIAAGKEAAGRRLVAVIQRDWLLGWTSPLRASGFSRLRALPVQLCLPLQTDHLAAALMVNGDAMELVIRYSADEGIGLPLTNADDANLPDQVLQLVATMAGERAVDLSLPHDFIGEFESALASGRYPVRLGALHELNWASLIEAAADTGPDLMSGVSEPEATGINWQPWRWPLRLALLLLVLNIAALQIDSWRLQSQAADLQQSMVNTYQRTFPNETTVPDPLAQMQKKIALSRRQAGEVLPDDFLALAAAFGDVWANAPIKTQAETQTQNQTQNQTPASPGASPQAIAGLAYRDQTLEVRFKPDVKPSLESAQSSFAERSLAVHASEAQGGASVWQIRSAR
jgi:general secretion pathway protein L